MATPKSIWLAWSDLSPVLAINLPRANTAAARTLKRQISQSELYKSLFLHHHTCTVRHLLLLFKTSFDAHWVITVVAVCTRLMHNLQSCQWVCLVKRRPPNMPGTLPYGAIWGSLPHPSSHNYFIYLFSGLKIIFRPWLDTMTGQRNFCLVKSLFLTG